MKIEIKERCHPNGWPYSEHDYPIIERLILRFQRRQFKRKNPVLWQVLQWESESIREDNRKYFKELSDYYGSLIENSK